MKRKNIGFFGLALSGLLLLGAQARAVPVSYTATGVFSSSGTSVFTAPGVTISYTNPGLQTVDADPTTNAGFGSFNTSGTTAVSPVAVSSGFTLTIFQVVPTLGSASFVGTLSGTISADSSGAVIQFNAPLSQTIGGLTTYQIANAALGIPGRILLAAPPTGGGVTAIEGLITAIPEPSAMVLVGMGAVAPLGAALRRRALGARAAV